MSAKKLKETEKEIIETLEELSQLVGRFSDLRFDIKDVAKQNGADIDDPSIKSNKTGEEAVSINEWTREVHNSLARAIELIPIKYNIENH